ncbi:FtsX-like permease family protein [Demequina sp. NBRC 110054]|uniref:FtsX-like permease family protein n=1 Tax=Demequina sp. NBRC 110054 TaxID=1570343 RepID=UPI0009FDD9B5|nr:ABC transporter permease [Demequina sp. NBRC 110054]
MDWSVAVAGTRRAWGFVAASSLAGLIGVFVIVGGFVAYDAGYGRSEIEAARSFVLTSEEGGGALVQGADATYYDATADVTVVELIDAGAVGLPPGVERLPGEGELVVSPAAAELIESDANFAARYPGEVIGIVGDVGLVGPNELVVWQGVGEGVLDEEHAFYVSGFGETDPDHFGVPSEVQGIVPVLVVGFLLPVVVLFYEAASNGAEGRQVRLAALRLTGASMRRLRRIAVFETLVATLPGVLLGTLAFGPVAGVLAPFLPFSGGVWPDQLRPSAGLLFAVVLAMISLAAVVGWWSLARVRGDFLSVVKHARTRKLRRLRLVWLAAGLMVLGGATLGDRTAEDWTTTPVKLLGVAAVLLMVGLIRGLPVIVNETARLVERAGGSWVLELGASKTTFSPAAISRVATGAMSLVLISGIFLTLIPLGASTNSRGWREAFDEDSWDLLVTSGASELPDQGDVLKGVREFASVGNLNVELPQGRIVSVAVVDCAELTDLLDGAQVCAPGGTMVSASFHGDLAEAVPVVEYEDDAGEVLYESVGAALGITATQTDDAGDIELMTWILGADVVVDSGVMEGAEEGIFPYTVVADASAGLETARTSLMHATNGSARTVREMIAESERTTILLRKVAQMILIALGIVAAATVAAALSGHLRTERAALIDLWRIGVPVRTVRRSLLVQTAFALVPGVALALPLGIAMSAVFVGLDLDRYYGVPWRAMTLLAIGALAIPLVTAATMSSTVRIEERSRSPLRTE